ncbi:MAG: hypothetical protein BWK76_07895 [Desulfobulbaceae bacterium A2]|nr:MAG: hypothetical protein BWK76_07895 [Desulfobulbaceae bacterium A2]
MKTTDTTMQSSRYAVWAVGAAGMAIGLWSLAALTGALVQANFQVGEVLRQYMVAVGFIGEYETLVDFYTHIKGVEYIICAAFFVAFPVYFKYLNRKPGRVGVQG